MIENYVETFRHLVEIVEDRLSWWWVCGLYFVAKVTAEDMPSVSRGFGDVAGSANRWLISRLEKDVADLSAN